MSARISGLSLKHPKARDAYRRFRRAVNPASLAVPTLCLARAFAIEALRDRAAIDGVNAALRERTCASRSTGQTTGESAP